MTENYVDKFISAIQRKVNPEIIEKIDRNELCIKEESKTSKNKKVIIKSMKKGCMAFNIDKHPREVYLFKEETKVSDEIIIYIKENKEIIVFIIEMKSDKISSAFKQIKYGKIYIDFLIGILEEEIGYEFHKEYRGYIFTTKCSEKHPTKIPKKIKATRKLGDIYLKSFPANSNHDFRYLSLPIEY